MGEAFEFFLAVREVEWDVVDGEFSLIFDDGWSSQCLFDDLGGQILRFLLVKS